MSAPLPMLFLIFVSTSLTAWLALRGGLMLWARYRSTFTHSARNNLADLFLFVDPVRLFHMNLLLVLITTVFLWFFTTPFFALLVAVLLILLPRYGYRWLRARRLRRFEAQLPDALMMLAGTLRAGSGLTLAMEGMVRESRPPLSQEFELLLREQRLGVDLDTALTHLSQRLPIADFHLVVAALRIARSVGGNLAETLESLADTLRRKHIMEGKIRALTAQGKMQGIVMASLPVLMTLVLLRMEPEATGGLFHTRLGWGVLAVMILMECMGYLMIRKILRIDV